FTEWTSDGKLRHPVYLGLRDDKKPSEVAREERARVAGSGYRVAGSSGSEPKEPATRYPLPATQSLLDQPDPLQSAQHDGVLALPGGETLTVTNLHKVFWPASKLTKGDLFRYHVRVAPYLLPAVADRPLVMKRFPNGVGGKPFYQHRVETHPRGVR